MKKKGGEKYILKKRNHIALSVKHSHTHKSNRGKKQTDIAKNIIYSVLQYDKAL